MDFLAESDDRYAEAKTALLYAEILCKRVRARVFVGAEGPIEQRKALTEGDFEVIAADESLCKATEAFEALKARRSRAEIVIDVWRSCEASRRKT